MELIRVFFSTTSDDATFEKYPALEKVCEQLEDISGKRISAYYWKENIPGGASYSSTQDMINEFVKGKYDIYLGCLGSRYGIGTIDEFNTAIREHTENGRPKEILFGFDESPINPFTLDEKFVDVISFRKSLEKPDKNGLSVLYFTFTSEETFMQKLRLNIGECIRNLENKIRGGVYIEGR